MKIVHFGPPKPNKEKISFGGLQRFLDEICVEQIKLNLEPEIINCKYEQGIFNTEFDLENYNKDVIFHFHDWYGGALVEKIHNAGFHKIISSTHLPLRFGFTYRETSIDWTTKYIYEQQIFDFSKVIISPSKYVQNFISDEYGLHKNSIPIIPHGVDLETFKITASQNRNINILVVGRFVEQKGIGILIRAFKKIKETLHTASLTIVGNGDLQNELILLAKKEQVNDVVFKNELSKQELNIEYNNATLLVIPSICEPFGLVGLEAMAAGCPVLSTSPSGTEEYLEKDELLFSLSPNRMANELLVKIQKILKNENSRIESRERAEKFTWQKTVQQFNDIYKKL